jgi:hypothetical protein
MHAVTDGGEVPQSESWDAVQRTRLAAVYGSVRSRKVELALDRGEMIPSSRDEARMLMAFGAVLCLATVGLIAASA